MHVHFVGSVASFTETPCDVVAAVGTIATFQCAASKQLDNIPTNACWKYKESSSLTFNQGVELHTGTEENFELSQLRNITYKINGETNNLTLNNVKFTDAGVYVCYKCATPNNQADRADAELIVFGELCAVQQQLMFHCPRMTAE